MSTLGYYAAYRNAITEGLSRTLVSDRSGTAVDAETAFARLCEMTASLKTTRGTLFFCGNGASAAMAGHMALDWLKAADVRAMTFNDPVGLTAIGNDLGYEKAFSVPVRCLSDADDVLVTISSSGNSPSVVKAIEAARDHRLRVVTFSGFKPDNQSRQLGDLNFYVPCKTYGIAESCHQVLLHAWLDRHLGLKEWES